MFIFATEIMRCHPHQTQVRYTPVNEGAKRRVDALICPLAVFLKEYEQNKLYCRAHHFPKC